MPVVAWTDPDTNPVTDRKAPMAISGDNVYIVWFTDRNTLNTNGEVIFRASNDGGATFVDKINLSNTNNTAIYRHNDPCTVLTLK